MKWHWRWSITWGSEEGGLRGKEGRDQGERKILKTLVGGKKDFFPRDGEAGLTTESAKMGAGEIQIGFTGNS